MTKTNGSRFAAQLVAVMDRLYINGYTTMSGGNLSQRDNEGNIWITPSGVDKGRLRACDIVMVKSSGEVVGKHNPSVELPFHSMVLNGAKWAAVLHAHSPATTALSLIGQLPNMAALPIYSSFVHSVGRCGYGLPGSEGLAVSIVSKINSGSDVVVLDNHGVVVVAEDIFSAYSKFEAVEHAAQLMLNTCILNHFKIQSDSKINIDFSCERKEKLQLGEIDGVSQYQFNDALRNDVRSLALADELVGFRDRAARIKCIHSFFGAFAVRCSDTEFLVIDSSMESENALKYKLVSASGNVLMPSLEMRIGNRRLGDIFAAVLRGQPVGCAVIAAIPSGVMSFSGVGERISSRIIPESYMQLRDICHMSYNEFVHNPLGVAGILSSNCPVVLVENTLLLAMGKNLTKCYDALEVCEFTANALLHARQLMPLGNINKICDEEIDKIKLAFNLK